MKKTKKDLQNQLYIPIKLINGKKEYMLETHGKIKTYRSIPNLKKYAPDHDLIATYKISSITNKP